MCIYSFFRAGPKLAVFEGADQSEYKGTLQSFNSAHTEVLAKLQDSLDTRFKDLNRELIRACDIVNFKCWPDKPQMTGTSLFI